MGFLSALVLTQALIPITSDITKVFILVPGTYFCQITFYKCNFIKKSNSAYFRAEVQLELGCLMGWEHIINGSFRHVS